MDANHRLHSLIGQLQDEFGEDAVVNNPEHPLLLRSPDLLTAINGSLTAVFTPHVLEERNPAHLVTRLIACRLALPAHTKTALLLEESQESRFGSSYAEFSLVTTPADGAVKAFLADQHDFRSTPQIEPAVKKFAVKQMDRALAASELGFRASRVIKRKHFRADIQVENRDRRIRRKITAGDLEYSPMNRTIIYDNVVSILDAGTKSSLKRQIDLTSSGYLLESYRSEYGYIHPVRDEPHMAIAYHADEIFGLRNRITTASAFSGIFLVPSDDPEVAERAVSRWNQHEVVDYE